MKYSNFRGVVRALTLFIVSVPVLSEHRMDMAAMSSIAARRVTMAPAWTNGLVIVVQESGLINIPS